VIWDSLTTTITVGDNRININDNATIQVSAIYDYDSAPFDGTLTLNYTTYVQSSAQRKGYTISSASGDSYGITTIATNDDNYVIWDSLTITITNPTDQRINVDANITGMVVSAIYDYDSSAFDGTFSLNDTTYDYSTVGRRGYTVSTVTGDTHGISVINMNDDTYCIWDRVLILTLTTSDSSLDVNSPATVSATAKLEYDNHPLGLGDSLAVSDGSTAVTLLWDATLSVFSGTMTETTATTIILNTIDSCNEATYGITTGDTNALSVTITWTTVGGGGGGSGGGTPYYTIVVTSNIKSVVYINGTKVGETPFSDVFIEGVYNITVSSKVVADNSSNYKFSSWNSTALTNPSRTVALYSNMALFALYSPPSIFVTSNLNTYITIVAVGIVGTVGLSTVFDRKKRKTSDEVYRKYKSLKKINFKKNTIKSNLNSNNKKNKSDLNNNSKESKQGLNKKKGKKGSLE